MSRSPRFSPTQNDKQEYTKLVRSAKAKAARIKGTHGRDVSGDVKLLKIDQIDSRKDFNKIKEQLKDFTNRNNKQYSFVKNKEGISASKAELSELRSNTLKAQKIADKIRKEIEKKPFYTADSDLDKKASTTVGQQMLSVMRPDNFIYRPKDFDFSTIKTTSRLRDIIDSRRERANPAFFDKRKDDLKKSIIKAVQKAFNSGGDDLVDRILDISNDDLYELFLQFEEFQFAYRYTQQNLYPTADGNVELDDDIERLNYILDRYEAGDIGMDMKGFD